MYKLIDEEVDAIINGWSVEWKVPISVEELPDIEAGPQPDAPVEKEQTLESEKES